MGKGKIKKAALNNIAKYNSELIAKRKASKPSDGESHIMCILRKNGIQYEREVYRNGLYNPQTYRPLFFDFFLPDYNVVIEFDGPHHFKPVFGNKQFWRQQLRDQVKNDFCRANGIAMLRISFLEKDVEGRLCRFFDKHFPN